MLASLFGDIVENALCQHAFDIVIQTHHLEWWCGMPLDILSVNTCSHWRHCVVCKDLWLYLLLERSKTLSLRRKTHDQHIEDIYWTSLDAKNVLFLLWSVRLLDLYPIENIWSRLPSYWFVTKGQSLLLMNCWSCKGICTCTSNSISV